MINSVLRVGLRKLKSVYENTVSYIVADSKSLFDLDVDFQFDSEMSLHDSMLDDSGSSLSVLVGTGGFLSSRFSFGFVPDNIVIRPIINMFHEAEHIHQYAQFRHVTHPTNEDVYLAVNKLARIGNDLYYLYPENYYHNPREIRAEQAGVTEAYDYLCEVFSDVDDELIESLVLDYVNERASNECYYIKQPLGEPFTDIWDVNRAFDDAFEQSKTSQRMYMQRDNHDVVGDLFWNHDEWSAVSDAFFRPSNRGYMQDKIVASVNVFLHPEYLDDYPCITAKGVDLSDMAVFGKRFPDIDDVRNKRVSDANLRLGDVGVDVGSPNDVSFSRPLPDIDCSDNGCDDIQFGE